MLQRAAIARVGPVLGNDLQVQRAGGGLYYDGYEEFAETLSWLLAHPAQADAMGRGGRAYFERNYAWDVVMAKYERLLNAVAG